MKTIIIITCKEQLSIAARNGIIKDIKQMISEGIVVLDNRFDYNFAEVDEPGMTTPDKNIPKQ